MFASDLAVQLFANAPMAILMIDLRAGPPTITYGNPVCLERTGFCTDQLLSTQFYVLTGLLDRPNVLAWVESAFRERRQISIDAELLRQDGSTFGCRLTLTPMQELDGSAGNYLVFVGDLEKGITPNQASVPDEPSEILIDAIESIQDAFGVFDAQDRLILCNDLYAQTFTLNSKFSEIVGMSFADLVRTSVRDRGELMAPGFSDLESWVAERTRRHREPEGSTSEIQFSNGVWLRLSERPTRNGGIASVRTDITEFKHAQHAAEHLAFHDQLTSLPNRHMLLHRLSDVQHLNRRGEGFGAVFMLDIDHFKTINDTRGHDFGDRVLATFASRLRKSLRDADQAFRLGGDEFLVLLLDMGNTEEEAIASASRVADKIHGKLSEPFQFDAIEFSVTSSIGIALFATADLDIAEVIKAGDLALYEAKRLGRNSTYFFNQEIHAKFKRREAIELTLRAAIDHQEFDLYFQPQVDSHGKVLGAEALLRWLPDDGPVRQPNDFVGIAEDSGLIVPIGQWVLQAACNQLANWQRNPATAHLTVSVNVSPRQFREAGFPAFVSACLQRSGANPASLTLEITEALLSKPTDKLLAELQALKALGVRLCIDDFGLAHASLKDLKKLPIHFLKIDRTFLQDLEQDGDCRAVVRSILFIASTFGLRVIAEGVETAYQHEVLTAEGCEIFQGYLFAKPLRVLSFDPFAALLPRSDQLRLATQRATA